MDRARCRCKIDGVWHIRDASIIDSINDSNWFILDEQTGIKTPITDYADLELLFPINCTEIYTY